MSTTVGIPFSNATSDEGDYLIIDQEEYDFDTGVTTSLDITNFLFAYLGLYGGSAVDVHCGMNADGESFDSHIYVYPSSQLLVYDHGITWGSTIPVASEIVTTTQLLKFSVDNSATLDFPVIDIISHVWKSEKVYDAEGNVTANPTVKVVGRTVSLSNSVRGSLEVKYSSFRDTYLVAIRARFDAEENVFQSVFYARFDGGIEMHSIEPPPNAEENYAAGVTCDQASNYGGGTSITTPDGGTDEPTVEAETLVKSYGYCTDFGHEGVDPYE